MIRHTIDFKVARIRFEFRKNHNKKAFDIIARAKPEDGVPPETPGSLQVILIFGKTSYGPYATGIKTTKGIWDARHSSRPSEVIRDLNRRVNALQSGLEEAHIELIRQNRDSNQARIIDGSMVMGMLERMRTGNLSPVTLPEVYGEFLAWKKSMIEPNRRIRKEEQIAPSTFKTYPKRWILIQQFLIHTKQPKMPVQNVGFRVATELKEWLSKQSSTRAHKRPYDTATVSKVIKLLKMLLTYAQSKEYIGANPLATFAMSGGSAANPKPLSREQIHALETCDLPPMLRFQCDSWLVAAELCLHYSDYMELSSMKFITSDSGIKYIQHERAKQAGTSLLQTVNLTPRAIRLLDKYGGPLGLYYASSAYFSKQLKIIARLVDLRDENGNIIALQFGQGRDTGLTERARQGANNMAITKLGGWSSPAFANRYINDAVGIVESFASGIQMGHKDQS